MQGSFLCPDRGLVTSHPPGYTGSLANIVSHGFVAPFYIRLRGFKINIKKQILRDISVARRNNLDQQEKLLFDDKISGYLKDVLDKEKVIAAYYPIKNEVSLLNLFKDYKIILPVINDDNQMIFKEYLGKDHLIDGRFNIKTPDNNCKVLEPEMAIIPMLGFNNDKYRLGYGGGYYDRYFEGNKSCKLIGVAYEGQEILELEPEEHDIKMDIIVTEKGIIN